MAAADDDEANVGFFRRARAGFRSWRRSRPFWGGLLVILGAAEILLSEKAPLPLIIHIGLQGLAGYLVPAILLVCGVLLWFHPVQRVFYSVLAVLLALGSWITSNLGGFFLGMLLGVIGGSLAFAWTRGAGATPAPATRDTPRHREPSSGLDLIFRPRDRSRSDRPAAGSQRVPADDDSEPGRAEYRRSEPANQPGRPARGRWAGRALPTGPLAVAVLAAAWHQGYVPSLLASASPTPTPTATSSPSPTATPDPPPSPSPTGSPSASITPSPTASPTPSQTPKPSPSPRRRHKRVRRAVAHGPAAATALSSLTAGTAVLSGLTFDGVARVPTARGTVAMLKFSMTSMTLSGGATLTFRIDGRTPVTTAASLGFSGDIVFYTTRLTGDLRGSAVVFTPRHPPGQIGSDITLTHLVTDQPYASADALTSSGLQVHAS